MKIGEVIIVLYCSEPVGTDGKICFKLSRPVTIVCGSILNSTANLVLKFPGIELREVFLSILPITCEPGDDQTYRMSENVRETQSFYIVFYTRVLYVTTSRLPLVEETGVPGQNHRQSSG